MTCQLRGFDRRLLLLAVPTAVWATRQYGVKHVVPSNILKYIAMENAFSNCGFMWSFLRCVVCLSLRSNNHAYVVSWSPY